MSAIIKELEKLTSCKANKKEDRQEYLDRLVKAVLDAPEDDWAALSDEAQDWTNEAVTAIKAEEEIADPDAKAAPKGKAALKVAEPPEDEEEEEEAEEEAEDEEEEEEEAEEEEEEADDEEDAEEEEAEEEEAPKVKGKAKAAPKAAPAKAAKAKKAKVEEEEEEAEEDEDEEIKPKKAKAKPAGKKSGNADKFRRAFLKALMAGKSPNPVDLIGKLGISMSNGYAMLQANEIRKTVGVLREMELLSD